MLLPPVTIDDIKKFIIFNVEICRRLLLDKRNSSSKKDSMILQYVMLLDLKGAGVSTLDMELIPFAVDLARHHFPGYIGSIFVLNYGWMYSGIWQIFKRILPEESLSRIFFPSSNKELLDYFDDDDLLLEHGGNDDYQYNLKNYDIYQLYGKPSSVLSMPKSLYRVTSFDSSHEVFFTPYSTPYSSRPTTPIGDNNNNMSPSVINIRPPFKHRSSDLHVNFQIDYLSHNRHLQNNSNNIINDHYPFPHQYEENEEDDEEERDGGQNNSSSSILNHEISTSLVSSPTNTKNLSSYSDSPISTTATTATTGLSIPKSRLYKLTRIHKTLKIYFERLLYRFISRRVTGVLYYMVMFVVFRGGLFNEFWKVITQNAFST
nr:8892_t:CDS:2 [Entrophospora candida]